MRLKITLFPQTVPTVIPVNYNHLVYAEIGDKIKRHNDAFKGDRRLKNLGIFKERFRIYTFSFLRFKNFLIENDEVILTNPEEFNFFHLITFWFIYRGISSCIFKGREFQSWGC